MKIAVLTGSPHKNGTTTLLADRFIEGARAKGHEVYRFDAAFRNIHPCLGCDACGMSGPCVHKDDIETEAIQKFYIMTVPVQQVLVVTLYFTSIMMTQQPLHFIK